MKFIQYWLNCLSNDSIWFLNDEYYKCPLHVGEAFRFVDVEDYLST